MSYNTTLQSEVELKSMENTGKIVGTAVIVITDNGSGIPSVSTICMFVYFDNLFLCIYMCFICKETYA